MSIVAFRQKPPDQYHRGTGSDAQQNTTRQVTSPERHFEHLHSINEHDFPGSIFSTHSEICTEWHFDIVHRLRSDECQKQGSQEKAGNGIHGKWFDGPVDKQRQTDGTNCLSCFQNFSKVNFHHDGVHHEKQTDRDRNGNDGRIIHIDRHPIQGLSYPRRNLA